MTPVTILRFNNVPELETVLVERPGDPFLGVGEATIGPTGGAIANAIYDAVGLRLRRTPFTAPAPRRLTRCRLRVFALRQHGGSAIHWYRF